MVADRAPVGPDPVPRGEPVLTVDRLDIRLPGSPVALVSDVSFTLRRGETLCLVGESGCGKSMVALALMRLLPAGARMRVSQLALEGEALAELGPRRMARLRGARIAMVFQEPMTSLNPAFPVGEQIAETIRRHRGLGRRAARARALEMLRRVGFGAAERRMRDYPHQLSGGMRQRVMIAMALANEPAVLIADEPTTALDTTVQRQVLDLIRGLQRDSGTALLLITHDLRIVAEIATEVAVMYAGRIVEHGPKAAVLDDPQHPYTIGLIASMPGLAGSAGGIGYIPGLVPRLDTLPEGCRFAPRCPFAARPCLSEPDHRMLGPDHRVACHLVPVEAQIRAMR